MTENNNLQKSNLGCLYIIGLFVVFVFFLIWGSVNGFGTLSLMIMGLLMFLFLLAIYKYQKIQGEIECKEQDRIDEEKRKLKKKVEEKRRKWEERIEEERQKLCSQYGDITDQITVEDSDTNNSTIFVFEAQSLFVEQAIYESSFEDEVRVLNIDYKFEDILGFKVYKNSRAVFSGTSSTENPSLGKPLLGGNFDADIEIKNCDYKVVLTLNNLSFSRREISFEDNQEAVERFVSILTVILHRKKKFAN